MDRSSEIDTSNLNLAELKIVAEKAERALDSCMTIYDQIMTKLEVQLRINMLSAATVLGLLSSKIDVLIIPLSILLAGNIAAAIAALIGSRAIRIAFSGSAWSDFENYRDIYGGDERGLLRYSIAVCLEKISSVIDVTNSRGKWLNISLRILTVTIMLSVATLAYSVSGLPWF
ncbi:MAG: hypothetical protein ISN29_07270 [Gammaproteobacteria bacterium AqS3]|nr:hypothetical protein [Gammaproteobacteria bacterium AqS3]